MERFLPTLSLTDTTGITQTATMRIDDDDAIANHVVADLRAATFDQDDMIATWPKGVYIGDHGGGEYTIRPIDSAFRACGLTRIRRSVEPFPTVHAAGNHRRVGENFPVLTMPGEQSFLMMTHSDNVSGRKFRSSEKKLSASDADLLKLRFGVDLKPNS